MSYGFLQVAVQNTEVPDVRP